MIARVRIAPVEQWGEWHSRNGPLPPGTEIEIITNSCAVDPLGLDLCGHPSGNKWWEVSQETVEKYGKDSRHRWICEHMLEMD